MDKRKFTTAPAKGSPNARSTDTNLAVRIKPRGSTDLAIKRTKGRPSAVARPAAGNGKALWLIVGISGFILLGIVVAFIANRQASRQSRPPVAATSGMTEEERLLNQRYGGDMGGKTIKEWMDEHGETDYAKARQEARKHRPIP